MAVRAVPKTSFWLPLAAALAPGVSPRAAIEPTRGRKSPAHALERSPVRLHGIGLWI